MTITADSIRSGISEMSAYSRVSIKNEELGKASFKQRLAYHFNRSEAKRTNQATIDALRTAVLSDPRYSGIQDKVNLVFDGMGSKHAIRAKDVKKAFATLDNCAFKTEAGRKSFLVQDMKMRLMAGVFTSPKAGGGPINQDSWAFSFKNEWRSGRQTAGSCPGIERWAPYTKSMEPLIGRMIDELSARKGGMQNITAADAQELSGKVWSMLNHIGDAITSSDLPAKYHDSAFALMAKTLANSPAATATPYAALNTADEYHFIFNELVGAKNSNKGSKYLIDNAIAWMGAMCAPLESNGDLQVFVANDMDFDDAARLGLPPEKARRLMTLLTFETARTLRSNDVGDDLMNADSIPRQLLNFPNLTKTGADYRLSASLLASLRKENVGPEMRNALLESLSVAASAAGTIPIKGNIEAVAPNGERLELEWSFHLGIVENFSINHFDQVA